jgi:glyoxylase-like metal-dependent hydrolase (beta-lactamase superfamily II)
MHPISSVSRRAFLAGSAAVSVSSFLPAYTLAKAPMLGLAESPYHRYKIGAFEITAVNDGFWSAGEPFKIFGVDQPAEAVSKLAEANHLPGQQLQVGFTPVIVNTGTELVLFDAGNGQVGSPNAGRLPERLKTAGYAPDQIDLVIITHCHPDHIGGLMSNGAPLFPNARYVIGETEYAFWSAPERLSGPTESVAKLVQSNVTPLKDKMTFVKDGAEPASGIRAFETFGHTPGHMAWHIENGGQRLFLGGDFCNHYVLSLKKPEWHVIFDTDKEQAAKTRFKVLDMLANDRLAFTSYHMPFPSIGYVEKSSDGYVYVPAAYEFSL